MEQGFFTYLPSEMIINILSRLPARTATSCKCVCRPWLSLLESEVFAKSHLSRAVPGLALRDERRLTLSEFEDDHLLDCEHINPVITKTSLVTSFRVYSIGNILCSANGLLLLRGLTLRSPGSLCICNPITREYIDLDIPKIREDFCSPCWIESINGFGVSKRSGQHKVVMMISHNHVHDLDTELSDAHVYALGSGSWRRIRNAPPFFDSCDKTGAFVNGKLHWLVFDINGFLSIYIFDLETEVFSSFAFTPLLKPEFMVGLSLHALDDRLCFCDCSAEEDVNIWLMKEYGDEKSWTKEFVMSRFQVVNAVGAGTFFSPVRILKGGEMLMANAGLDLFCYSKKKKSIWKIQDKPHSLMLHAVTHTSTFLSLRTFQMERVSFF